VAVALAYIGRIYEHEAYVREQSIMGRDKLDYRTRDSLPELDWYSRRVLSWRVSNALDTSFYVDALEEAIERHGPPEIFNTDQGSHFTSEDFTNVLKQHGIRISMDGKGRWIDNVFMERLLRSVKYEEVYLKA